MVRIQDVVPGTIAAELRLRIGSRIVRINGEPVRDNIDFRFKEVDGRLEVEVSPADGARSVVYDIEKDAGEPLGVVPAPDPVRECANECVFCFIDGNPPGVRPSLNVRDDDFRLSFTYGSYVTLTNLGPRGLDRLIEQRISPLYVSVHATEPEVRMRLLGVRRGGDIMERLERLTAAGLEVHTQVVLCPGWNDGGHLDRTMEDLWSLGPGVSTLSVVPVGLTRYNLNRPVRLLTAREAAAALEQIERARGRALAARGRGWTYAADELFFIAGRPIPDRAYYDGIALEENGVGAVRRVVDDLADVVSRASDVRARRVAVVTGTRMADVLEPWCDRLSRATGADFVPVPVPNAFFGETVTTAGLLPGADVERALAARDAFDAVLLPADAINADGRFIDDVEFARVECAASGARVLHGRTFSSLIAEL
ncbi:MAG: DUF512 domain-containing protein [Gemmatimonadota bacterium]